MRSTISASVKDSCGFTGYRPNKLPWGEAEDDHRCIELKKKLFDVLESVYHTGYTHFICGMAQGSDMYFCEAAVDLRNQHPEVTIEAALPCESQAQKWSEEMRNRYFRLVSECDYETMLQRRYTKDCMLKRNKYMVDRASVLIAVYDGAVGGTMQTVRYAMKKGLEIIQIKP